MSVFSFAEVLTERYAGKDTNCWHVHFLSNVARKPNPFRKVAFRLPTEFIL